MTYRLEQRAELRSDRSIPNVKMQGSWHLEGISAASLAFGIRGRQLERTDLSRRKGVQTPDMGPLRVGGETKRMLFAQYQSTEGFHGCPSRTMSATLPSLFVPLWVCPSQG